MPTNTFFNPLSGLNPLAYADKAMRRIDSDRAEMGAVHRKREELSNALGLEQFHKTALENYLASMGISHTQRQQQFFNTPQGHDLTKRMFPGEDVEGANFDTLPFYGQAHEATHAGEVEKRDIAEKQFQHRIEVAKTIALNPLSLQDPAIKRFYSQMIGASTGTKTGTTPAGPTPSKTASTVSPQAQRYAQDFGMPMPQEEGVVPPTTPTTKPSTEWPLTTFARHAAGPFVGTAGSMKALKSAPTIPGKLLGVAGSLALDYGLNEGLDNPQGDVQNPRAAKMGSMAGYLGGGYGGISGLYSDLKAGKSLIEAAPNIPGGQQAVGLGQRLGKMIRPGVNVKLKPPNFPGTPPEPVKPPGFGEGSVNVGNVPPNMQQVAPQPGAFGQTYTASPTTSLQRLLTAPTQQKLLSAPKPASFHMDAGSIQPPTPERVFQMGAGPQYANQAPSMGNVNVPGPKMPSMGNVNPQGYTTEMYTTLEQMGYPPEIVNIMKPEQVLQLFQHALGGFR